MRCSSCGGKMMVVDSRKVRSTIYRRRRCSRCGQRATSYEILVAPHERATFKKALEKNSPFPLALRIARVIQEEEQQLQLVSR